MKESRHDYPKSISRELDARANQVRNLIGDAHWLSDGHHKEALLRSMIARYLPTGVLVSRGFVLERGGSRRCSKEQDILVVDTTRDAALFDAEGLVITYSEHVAAAVSAKTALGKDEFVDSIGGLRDVASMRGIADPLPWAGVYFFDAELSLGGGIQGIAHKIAEWLGESNTEMSLASEWSIRVSRDFFCRIVPERRSVVVTACAEASSALFVARLADTVAAQRGRRAAIAQLLEDEYETEHMSTATW